MTSFTDISTSVDAVDPPSSLRALSNHHMWASDENRWSFRAITRRHSHPDRLEQRFMFLNTYLMDWKGDNIIFNAVDRANKPRVNARAEETGRYINENADIAALCEVWTNSEKNAVLGMWRAKPSHVHRITRRMTRDKARAFFRREEKSKGSSGLLTISQRFEIKADSRKFEEYQHESGFDGRADKGVLRAEIDVGFGPSKLLVYNTHLQAGGKKKALKQVIQLATFIFETRNERDPALVVGDFNINEYGTEPFSTEEVLNVKFKERVPDIVRRAVRETVEDGTPTGREKSEKAAFEILIDVMSVLSFNDLWAIRNGTPGYTSDKNSDSLERICPPDPHDDQFCSDDVPSGLSGGKRIDYIFLSEPSTEQSFTLDCTRPRRLRLERAPNAPGKDEVAFLSDHLGLWTKLLIVPT